jgi:hypothetical protein
LKKDVTEAACTTGKQTGWRRSAERSGRSLFLPLLQEPLVKNLGKRKDKSRASVHV